jgi:hypothetical protein
MVDTTEKIVRRVGGKRRKGQEKTLGLAKI